MIPVHVCMYVCMYVCTSDYSTYSLSKCMHIILGVCSKMHAGMHNAVSHPRSLFRSLSLVVSVAVSRVVHRWWGNTRQVMYLLERCILSINIYLHRVEYILQQRTSCYTSVARRRKTDQILVSIGPCACMDGIAGVIY